MFVKIKTNQIIQNPMGDCGLARLMQNMVGNSGMKIITLKNVNMKIVFVFILKKMPKYINKCSVDLEKYHVHQTHGVKYVKTFNVDVFRF